MFQGFPENKQQLLNLPAQQLLQLDPGAMLLQQQLQVGRGPVRVQLLRPGVPQEWHLPPLLWVWVGLHWPGLYLRAQLRGSQWQMRPQVPGLGVQDQWDLPVH